MTEKMKYIYTFNNHRYLYFLQNEKYEIHSEYISHTSSLGLYDNLFSLNYNILC